MKNCLALFLLVLSVTATATATTSRENRANKIVETTVQFGFDYRAAPVQLSAMYFLNADHLVGLKVGTHNSALTKQTNVAAQYKWYAENSFYFAGEVFYLNTREDLNGFLIFQDEELAEYKSLGAGIRIGNQWTWRDSFTLGCDWIGIGRRIGTFKKDSDRLEDTTYTLLNVIVGMTF